MGASPSNIPLFPSNHLDSRRPRLYVPHMSKPPVEAGQLWSYHDYRGRKALFLVVDRHKFEDEGWNLHQLSGSHQFGPNMWDYAETLLRNDKWEFLA